LFIGFYLVEKFDLAYNYSQLFLAKTAKLKLGSSNVIEIDVGYNSVVDGVSNNLFGGSLEMKSGHLSKILKEPYFTKTKNLEFSYFRFGGYSCENYDFSQHLSSNDPLSYLNWVNFSLNASSRYSICLGVSSKII